MITLALPVLAKLIYSIDNKVLIDAYWAIEFGICCWLVKLLMHSLLTSVQIPALCLVGNIVTGDDIQT